MTLKSKLIVAAIAAPIAAFGLLLAYSAFAMKFAYSTGERVGYVQKLSHRGWVCKTYEGELAMVNLPGQPAQTFAFSVPSDKVAAEIEAAAGKRVALMYEEHRGVPTSCFGDTGYFVVGVRKLEN